MPQRIMGLELLRGLCALLVAIYHCLLLSGTARFPTWGLYGVYVFFGISGAVLYHNYHALGLTEVPRFLLKRFARLAPLVWACIFIPVAIRGAWEPDRYFLNASLLQGLGAPGVTSYLTGGWSIGIEVVLYALFPTLLAFMANLRSMVFMVAVFFVLRVTFVGYILKGSDLDHAWGFYIQPAAFLFFFFGGMVIARVMPTLNVRPGVLGLVAVSCAAVLFAFPGSSFEMVLSGSRGALLSVLSLLLVASCVWSPASMIGHAVSKFFGDISYGLYLLHPIVWVASGHYLPGLSLIEHIALTLGVSTAVAWVSFRYYERPVRRWITRA